MAETFAVEQAEAFEVCDDNFHQTVNKNHGRIETHRCRDIGIPAYIRYVDPNGAWPDLRSLVMIEVQRRQGNRVTSVHLQPAGGCTDLAAGRAQPLGH